MSAAVSAASQGLLAGFELVVFDKDGTLIEFHAMWGGWMATLAAGIDSAVAAREPALATAVVGPLYRVMGVDPATGRVDPHGALAATPMAVLRWLTVETVVGLGLSPSAADAAVARAWHAPDPVALARPMTDLVALFRSIHEAGALVAVATSDDRAPTERTLAALGVSALVDATVCADDGIPVNPAPEMILAICRRLGIEPSRTAMVGDSTMDLQMGRAAAVGACIGVLSGTGTLEGLGPLADAVILSVAELLPDA